MIRYIAHTFYNASLLGFLCTLSMLPTELPIYIKPQTVQCSSLAQELPLVILICSYNNAPWIEKNLDSVLMQQYSNWRIVYFDDASTDGTASFVEQYLKKHSLENKCTVIENQTRNRKLKNLYTAFHHHIDDHEIIVQLDGDDWLAHEHVFSLINEAYQTYDIWMTYGNYQDVPALTRPTIIMDLIPKTIVEQRQFRRQFMFMHLRTFYGWLAKQINLQDLLSSYLPNYKSQFFPASNDAATIWPLFEMAWHRFAFIEEVLYCLNRSNPLNGFKVDRRLQRRSTDELQIKIPVYEPLEEPQKNRLEEVKNAQADCLIFSENSIAQLQELLNSIELYAENVDDIWLVYQAHTQDNEHAYRHLLLDNINMVHNFSITGTSIRNNLLTLLETTSNEYLLICHGGMHITDQINVQDCIQELERTGAYSFYVSMSHQSHLFDQHIWSDLYASKFNVSKYAWFNTLDMTLMRKKDFVKRILQLPDVTTLHDFIQAWHNDLSIDLEKIGLFYGHAKAHGSISTIKTLVPALPALPKRRKIQNKREQIADTESIQVKKKERRLKKKQLQL